MPFTEKLISAIIGNLLSMLGLSADQAFYYPVRHGQTVGKVGGV